MVPMAVIFASVVGIWIIVSGIKMALGRADLASFCRELLFVIIASGLMSGQGPSLVMMIYNTAIATMSGAASAVLQAAAAAPGTNIAGMNDASVSYTGVARLVYVAEDGFVSVMDMGWELWKSFSVGNLTGPLTGLLIIIPWFLLIVTYFSQVMVTLFRVAVFAGLSPFIMLGIGFGWSQGMVWQALKSLMGAGMVLYGATLAVGISLYAVNQVPLDPEEIGLGGSLFHGQAFLAIVLGVMGTIFVTEATAIANSITQSQFTNTAAAGMVGASVGAGLFLAKKAKPFLPPAARAAVDLIENKGGAMAGAARDALKNPGSIMGNARSSFADDMARLRQGFIERI